MFAFYLEARIAVHFGRFKLGGWMPDVFGLADGEPKGNIAGSAASGLRVVGYIRYLRLWVVGGGHP